MLPELFCYTCDEYRKDYKIMFPIDHRCNSILNQYDVVMCIHCFKEIKFHKNMSEEKMKELGIEIEYK